VGACPDHGRPQAAREAGKRRWGCENPGKEVHPAGQNGTYRPRQATFASEKCHANDAEGLFGQRTGHRPVVLVGVGGVVVAAAGDHDLAVHQRAVGHHHAVVGVVGAPVVKELRRPMRFAKASSDGSLRRANHWSVRLCP